MAPAESEPSSRTQAALAGQSLVHQGWPFTLRGGCGAEVRKLPQWLSLLGVAGNFGESSRVNTILGNTTKSL